MSRQTRRGLHETRSAPRPVGAQTSRGLALVHQHQINGSVSLRQALLTTLNSTWNIPQFRVTSRDGER